MIPEAFEGLLTFFFGAPQRVADQAGVGKLPVLHWKDKIIVALEFNTGGAVFFQERIRQIIRGTGSFAFDCPVHAHQFLVVSQNIGRFQFSSVPARRFLRRAFQQVGNHAEVVFCVWLVDANQGTGIVFNLTQEGIDDFHVGCVTCHEYDLVEAMMDQRSGDIIIKIAERLGPDGDGAQSQSRRSHVMGAVSDP